MVSGDVFRAPKDSLLLCVEVGSGVQIVSSAFITLVFAALGAPPDGVVWTNKSQAGRAADLEMEAIDGDTQHVLRRRLPVAGQPRRAADGPAGHVPAAGRRRGLRCCLPVGPRQPQVCFFRTPPTMWPSMHCAYYGH